MVVEESKHAKCATSISYFFQNIKSSGAESGQNSGSSCKLVEKADFFKMYSLDLKIVKNYLMPLSLIIHEKCMYCIFSVKPVYME